MSITIFDGNIFKTNCQTLVNTVNCVGIMGSGIALECRLRYPEMNEKYISLCNGGLINIGSLWLYKSTDRWILNFPTKKHWKDPSKECYLHDGLRKFIQTYKEKKIQSIAFPLLGSQHGGIDGIRSLEIMESYLKRCEIPVEIYRYDQYAPDDLYDRFRNLITSMSIDEIKSETGLRLNYIKKVLDALDNPNICQLNRLASLDGIGIKTLEKVFIFARSRLFGYSDSIQKELKLDFPE